jgi:hypothetical protein
MTTLKLGPLPKVRYIRKTVLLPEPLAEELDEYAAEHSRLHEPVEAAVLIPHMLENFLQTDRGWRATRTRRDRTSPQRIPAPPADKFIQNTSGLQAPPHNDGQ